MKIAIVAPSHVPFMLGGAERVWNGLVEEINAHTPHTADLIKLPAPESRLPELVASYRSFSELDLSSFDMVISGKYPAWMVSHERHVVYMLHPLRGLYDAYRGPDRPLPKGGDRKLSGFQRFLSRSPSRDDLPELFGRFSELLTALGEDCPQFSFPGPLARQMVHYLDRVALSPESVSGYFAISRTVAARSGYFPGGAVVQVVSPPSNLEGLECGDFEYFFAAGRLEAPKRFDLLVKAMKQVEANVPLKIAGTGPQLEELVELAGSDPRIQFLGLVSDQDLAGLYANALAVPFLPLDEDLGLITHEAMGSGKPVITCHDSGGPTEFVKNGLNGYVVGSTPEAVARCLQRLADDRDLARRLGRAASRTALQSSWSKVVKAVIPGPTRSSPVPKPSLRPKLVITSTYPIHPLTGGGPLRVFKLYRELSRAFDLEVVSLGAAGSTQSKRDLAEGFVETLVPKSLEHEQSEQRLAGSVGLVLTDIAASRFIGQSPAYLQALKQATAGASAVLLAHPYLYPAVRMVDASLPTVLDAHNAEFSLKGSTLPMTSAGRHLAQQIAEVERAAIENSVLTVTCSSEDSALLAHEYGVDQSRFLQIPNGVDTAEVGFLSGRERRAARGRWIERYRAAGGGPRDGVSGIALFIGSWHPPNLDAGELLLKIAPELPETLFVHLGSHCWHFEGRRMPPNVQMLGVVSLPVKLALLRVASLALNPMAGGSGTNLKLVEYFAAGAPALSTRFGVRGTDAKPGVHLRVAEIDGFGEGVALALEDPVAGDELAARARALVEDRYEWSQLGATLLRNVQKSLDMDQPADRPKVVTAG